MSAPALIVHIVVRFDYGGLENGVVNVVDRLSAGGAFRHAIVALTEATSFRSRVPAGVPVFALGKRPGKDPAAYLRLFRLLKVLRPDIVHSRNLGTLDCSLVALLAGVPIRIHGEHGWDVFDPDGTNRKYRLLRRAFSPAIHEFVTVSEELREWLVRVVGIASEKTTRICNGVDVEKFRPREPGTRRSIFPAGFADDGAVVIGSVTRFSEIKDPLNLVEAFLRLRADPGIGPSLRLVMFGGGELHARARDRIEEAGAADQCWLPGSRDDVAELLRDLDVFVLGSKREGISNTVLEAMASGLPVVATATGGNGELIEAGRNGALVPVGDRNALAEALRAYVASPELRVRHGASSRERAVARFSIASMADGYRALYERRLAALPPARRAGAARQASESASSSASRRAGSADQP